METQVLGRVDLVVVGGGLAGLCAAVEGVEAGLSVTLLERAPREYRGGNTAFAGGLMRFSFEDAADVLSLMPSVGDAEAETYEFGSYPPADFLDDLALTTEYRCDPELAGRLAEFSRPTMQWLMEHGIRFEPRESNWTRTPEGTTVFPTSVVLVASGGGRQIVETLYRVAEDAGVDIVYGAQAIDASRAVDGHATTFRLNSGAVCVAPSTAIVFATGGFHSSAEMRAQYLGAGWELAKVRGSQFSNGDGASIGRRMGARLAGHWSGCHAVAWEPNAPDPERLETAGMFNRDSFPFSIMVNERGERFLDEGSDFRYRMYSKNGRHILAQPSQVAWQVFDGSMADLLLDSYHNRYATKVQAQTIEELAAKMDGVDASALVWTIEQFNAAIPSDAPEFAPHVKDGRGTVGLALPKSNWAVPFLQPPFRAYQVTAGITFTFAGLAIDGDSRVIGVGPLGRTMPGLYAAGEAAGGLFYFSYPAGSALTTAAVFGRVAGRSAVKDIRAAVSS